jgi:hypothetical protein
MGVVQSAYNSQLTGIDRYLPDAASSRAASIVGYVIIHLISFRRRAMKKPLPPAVFCRDKSLERLLRCHRCLVLPHPLTRYHHTSAC